MIILYEIKDCFHFSLSEYNRKSLFSCRDTNVIEKLNAKHLVKNNAIGYGFCINTSDAHELAREVRTTKGAW